MIRNSLSIAGLLAITLLVFLEGFNKPLGSGSDLANANRIVVNYALMYQKPPDWFFSVRHTLGRVLVKAKMFEEAGKIYREDLVVFPENGWALKGLYNSLEGQQKHIKAVAVKKHFEAAWQWADIPIKSSRIE